jgi:uncharacterized integral membrane protein (TIGR00698 family)
MAILIPVLAAASLHPAVPGWAALLAGIVLALAFGNPHAARTRRLTPHLLALSVVGLGAGMNLVQVARVGLAGFLYTMIGIAGTLALGVWLGRRMRVSDDTATLIAVGTAICGGSAIAAAAPVIRARSESTSVALATVFVLNAAALLIFPVVGRALDLSQPAFGLWAALAIHDTSSVVAAAAGYGHQAEIIATTTKLARALWIVPVTLVVQALAAWHRGEVETLGAPKARRPWFILGFLAAAALVTFVPVLAAPGAWLAAAARRSLVLTLFLLGTGISRDALHRIGARPLVQGVVLWLVVASVTLLLIARGVIS